MSDSSVEKIFLYLVGFSFLLHVAVFALIYFRPEGKPPLKQEPYMVDLREMPEIQPTPPRQDKTKRLSDRRQRVEREQAPKGTRELDHPKPPPAKPHQAQPQPPRQPSAQPGRQETAVNPAQPQTKPRPEPGDLPGAEQPAAQDFFKPDRKKTQMARLFPSAGTMAQLEESYRKRFEADVAEGNTNFLNTDDIQFGSFLRRFETAVYGVWRYPAEAARNGVEGVVPVRITFNRKGEVEHVEVLESSRSRILDDEVLRTLHALGPIGGFPRNYTKDQFHLIAFFQYNISRGGMTGKLL
jgi:protein TonB